MSENRVFFAFFSLFEFIVVPSNLTSFERVKHLNNHRLLFQKIHLAKGNHKVADSTLVKPMYS